MKNKVANTIRSLGYSKIVNKSDQELTIRSTEWNVVESLFEDDFKELCGSQVVMQHSPVGEPAADGIENTNQRVQGQVRAIKLGLETNITAKLNPSQTIWPWLIEPVVQTLLFWKNQATTVSRQSRESREDPPRHRGPDSENELCTRFEAPDEHLIGIPLGVLKARDAIAVPMDR